MRSILLVDDKKTVIDEISGLLQQELAADDVEIRQWIPSEAEPDAHAAFQSRIDADTTLVITDADLTSQGQLGLFGASVVSWCQSLAIPVGDYSRNLASLPKAPELFELRVPPDPAKAAKFIAAIFRGFRDINIALANDDALLAKRSPAAVLATLLGQPEIESQISLYALRLGAASGALVDRVEEEQPSASYKRGLLTYIAGHLLLNVLRFPGPILSLVGLKAYLASDDAGEADVTALFEAARYKGPFADLDQYFWLSGVDAVLDTLMKTLPSDLKTETSGELHRLAIEKALSRQLARHSCPTRCHGQNGGFFCPFTERTVCQRSDCSVGSNSWIPQGAKLCRIERDFFDEWAPILGL
jgi:hypothetical protein